MKLLVVDDEPSLRRTLRIALESFGHSVAEAPSARAALALVGRERFDLAFLDLRPRRMEPRDQLAIDRIHPEARHHDRMRHGRLYPSIP